MLRMLTSALLASMCALCAQNIEITSIDGSREISGGDYRHIYVTKGVLTLNGSLKVDLLEIDNGGRVFVQGELRAPNVVVRNAHLKVVHGPTGVSSVNTLSLLGSSVLETCGKWVFLDGCYMEDESRVRVIPYSERIPESGTIQLAARHLVVGEHASIDASGSGDDPRGRGTDTNQGGSYGGRGGRHPTHARNTNDIYGDRFNDLVIEQGSRGGELGGGRITVYSSSLIVDGHINADGLPANTERGTSAGSGGGILLNSTIVPSFSGMATARGGSGSESDGAGGGGRIKVIVLNDLPDASRFDVSGGETVNDQYEAAGDGTLWLNYLPAEPVTSQDEYRFDPGVQPVLTMSVLDQGNAHGIEEALTMRAEITSLSFEILHVLDQTLDSEPWGTTSFTSGDTVTLRFPKNIEDGDYWVFIQANDGGSAGHWKHLVHVAIGIPETPSLTYRAVTDGLEISFTQPLAYSFTLEASDDLGRWLAYAVFDNYTTAAPTVTKERSIVIPFRSAESGKTTQAFFRLYRDF